jgi:poly(hydroxyalkanoate) depolymerase family esterase
MRLSTARSTLRLLRRLARGARRALAPTPPPRKRQPAQRGKSSHIKAVAAALRPGAISEVTGFGANPGALTMQIYTPRRLPPEGAPLVVVLHGCGQQAAGFAQNTGWVDWAERTGVPLVLPGQTSVNHRNGCFNWYRAADVTRGQGEAMSIRQMVRMASLRFASDRKRIFIVGLSAGGAMAAAMLAAYPAVFAGGAVIAGMPVGAARTSPMAMLRMFRADPLSSRPALVAAARAGVPPRLGQPWPRLSIWQGEADKVVDPGNAGLLATQWGGLHGCDPTPLEDAQPAPGARRRRWGKPGQPSVELWTLADLGHGFPIAAGAGQVAPWVLQAPVAAVPHIAAFWGLPSGASGG